MDDIAVVGGTTARATAAAAAHYCLSTCVVTATDGADSSTVTWTQRPLGLLTPQTAPWLVTQGIDRCAYVNFWLRRKLLVRHTGTNA